MCCTGMTTIRQVRNDALLNLKQRAKQKSQMNMLFIKDHAQHQSLQPLICHLYSQRQTNVGCYSHWFLSPSLLRLRMPLKPRLSVPWLNCHVCIMCAGRQWWDDSHVQHDPQGLPGGRRTETHLWGFQQGDTLLQDPVRHTQCLLSVSLSILLLL